MPTSPQHAAGIRIDPIPSLPCATATMPAATAAAAPPDEPPGVRSRFHGFLLIPKGESVVPNTHSSGVRVRPTTTAPAARSRRTTSWSSACGVAEVARLPMRIGSPRTGHVVLDRDRDAGERQVGAALVAVHGVGVGQRGLGADDLERTDRAVALGDAVRGRRRSPRGQ